MSAVDWRAIADELARVYRRVCEDHPDAAIEHLPLVRYDIAARDADVVDAEIDETDRIVEIMADATSHFILPNYAREAIAALEADGYEIVRRRTNTTELAPTEERDR